jgi:hypothetical protein
MPNPISSWWWNRMRSETKSDILKSMGLPGKSDMSYEQLPATYRQAIDARHARYVAVCERCDRELAKLQGK